MNYSAPNSNSNSRYTRSSFLASIMVLIISDSSFFCILCTTVMIVGPKMEGVTAFCPPSPSSAASSAAVSRIDLPLNSLTSSTTTTRITVNTRSRRRFPSLLQVATTSTSTTDIAKEASKNTTTKSSSTVGSSQQAQKVVNDSNKNNNNNKKSPRATTTTTTKASTINNNKDDESNDEAGVVGNWESLHGNWVLRPNIGGDTTAGAGSGAGEFDSANTAPRAVIHFLGGALVGKAPHVTYRYVLEKLAAEGFLIVATPFDLSFDQLATCDYVLTKFEAVAPMLAKQYGALPVVGIGHSCGALLQVLISSLFPDTPRAANALLSFNNKPVSEAVPFFEEFFAPAFSSLAIRPEVGGGASSSSSKSVRGPSSNDSLVLGLKLAKAASQGNLPSDELLGEAQRMFGSGFKAAAGQASSLFPSLPIPVPPFFGDNNNNNNNEKEETIKIPNEIRETYAKWADPTVTALKEAGVLPVIHETIVTLEQIPKLIDEVADGARDFNPTPASVRSAAGKAYRPRRTLIVGYKDDPIDESDEIEEVLKEARSITRMRRPMVEIDVERKVLGGGHAAPLLAPPLDVARRAEDLLGLETSQERLGYTEAAATVDVLVRWLEEGNL